MQNARHLAPWIFAFEAKKDAVGPVNVPESLENEDDAALAALEDGLTAEFDTLYSDDGNITAEALSRLDALAADLERVRTERSGRAAEIAGNRTQANDIAARVRGTTTVEPPAPEGTQTTEPVPVAAAVEMPVAAAIDPAIQTAIDTAVAAALETSGTTLLAVEPVTASGRDPRDDLPRGRRLNFSFAEIAARAPKVEIEPQTAMILAAADVPGYGAGAQVVDLAALAEAMNAKGMRLQDHSGEVSIATIKTEYEYNLDENSTPEQVQRIVDEIRNPEKLVAAGGWCAPSLPIYDLFNIAAMDGLIDLPTVGVTRGGIRWPTSPTLADVLGNVWTWTETNDMQATGATGGPSKPCFRVACPAFNDARLQAQGICVTAGNLTEKAYPEVVQNYIKLVMAAHYHVINQQRIAALVAASTALTAAGAADGAAANILNAVELGAVDYREKFGMENDAVLEVVFPRWSDSLFRADLARRSSSNPSDALNISDAEIMAWFDKRDVRVQWVADYQTRTAGAAGTALPGATAGLTAFPTSLQFLMYAAGTFVVGDGGEIDLGIIRDSTLNAKNDYTAAWTEVFNLVAEFGHESRSYTVPVCPDGVTGAGANAACPVA